MPSEKEMVVVSESHWDREWYLPFQEYRARLVILIDKLLNILDQDPHFTNFTFDGQTVVLEDYLEVRPDKEALLRKHIQDKRISVGPWYVLPDEFLVSGEALIRNLMLGHRIARSFGRVMKAGYIPDPFGHIAQLPQIMQGFDIDSVLFMRGMDDSFENLGLNLEFYWDAPEKVASVLAIYLKYGYGSVSNLSSKKVNGIHKPALRAILRTQRALLRDSATTILLLNNGGDHDEAQAHLPAVIRDWNSSPDLNEYHLVQGDFEYYISKLRNHPLKLQRYEGEFRGARHHYLLSGTFSARMWIKQTNAECQMLLENFAEPTATFAWMLGTPYPWDYLWTGWRWLLKNHPHDSICGCSIDEVHRDMETRFKWAKEIASEVTKESLFAIYNRIDFGNLEKGVIPLLIFNPLPWTRSETSSIDISVPGQNTQDFNFPYELKDSSNRIIPYQLRRIIDKPRLVTFNSACYRLSFIADQIPPCGYATYKLIPKSTHALIQPPVKLNALENQFYRVTIHPNGTFSIFDKDLAHTFSNLGLIEDVGDWGDEYDFSPPFEQDADVRITNQHADAEVATLESGPVKNTIRVKYNLPVPISLSFDRMKRCPETNPLPIILHLTLYPNVKRIDLEVELNNQMKDHRIRMLFPTGFTTDTLNVDGHFYVIDRPTQLPDGAKWHQPPSKTNHQNRFISVTNGAIGLTISNKGLPEYEAITSSQDTIIAITLLRSVGWLALPLMKTRQKEPAGPDFSTPEAQCLGKYRFQLSITTHSRDYLTSKGFIPAIEFSCPLQVFNPAVMRTAFRIPDHIFFKGLPIHLPEDYFGDRYLPPKLSFLQVEPYHLLLSACKKAEEEEALIVRIYNLSKRAETGKITLFQPVKSVKIVNLDETEVNDLQITDLKLNKTQVHFQISGSKIATFKIDFKKTNSP